MRLSLPAAKRWHSGWGSYPGHRGQDFGWGAGDQVVAAAPGRVVEVYGRGGHNGGFGNRVVIQHTSSAYTTYNHLATGTITVSVGQTVTRGQLIARMGSTGKSTAKHLHFELELGGRGAAYRVDPAPYYNRDLPGTPVINNQQAAKPAVTSSSPATVADVSEEDDMARNSGVYWEAKSLGANTIIYAIFNTESGYWHEYSNGTGKGAMPSAYNNALATALFTPSWAQVTESHAKELKRACAEVRG